MTTNKVSSIGAALGPLEDVRAGPVERWVVPQQRSAGPLPRAVPPAHRPRLSPRAEVRMVVAADFVAFALTLTVGTAMLRGLTPQYALVTMSVAAVTWRVKSLYSRRVCLSVLDDLPLLSIGVLVGLAPATALSVAFGDGRNLEQRTLLVGAALLVATVLCRYVAYVAVLTLRRRGVIFHPTVLIGSGAVAETLGHRIDAHPESGLRLVGRLANSGRGSGEKVPYLGSSEELARIVREQHVTNLIIAYGGMTSVDLVQVLRTADLADLEIHVVPRLFELATLHGSDDNIWGLPLARLRSPADRRLTRPVKRMADVIGASMALALAFPVLLAVALAVRIELGPGILFRQTRIGAHGQQFQLLKFRSMRPAVSDGHRWCVDQQELGRVGTFIRRYSLDELPQIWNVLRGDMSLVGPRPERPEFVKQFVAAFPCYAHRHRVPVGMTGLAAVNGLRGDTSIEERANFDNWYIENWSLWLDVKILLRTVSAVVLGAGE